eukprot:TRINITY_DN27859_c0_g1_i1.p1 TRINITY_DN27859_c0_g1~~TRINITY_DN27859_c0_g1_i1.p1  ORF type:complete len:431 (-),score=49.67 TRINITY_DN27859_c0_g1_i1:375-1667(-)
MAGDLVQSHETDSGTSLRYRKSGVRDDSTFNDRTELTLYRLGAVMSRTQLVHLDGWVESERTWTGTSSTCSEVSTNLASGSDTTDLDEVQDSDHGLPHMSTGDHDLVEGRKVGVVPSSPITMAEVVTAEKKDDGIPRFDWRNCVLVVLVVVCGAACQVPFEVMNSRSKGCAPLIALADHAVGMLSSPKAVVQPRRLPWSLHLGLAASNIGYAMLMGAALGTALPVTVLITLRNGELAANMLLGVCLLNRRYSVRQCVSVALVTVGLVITSVIGGKQGSSASGDVWSILFGFACMVGALFSRAAGGVLQERWCKSYDASVSELLFYRCALGLPMILLQWESISLHAVRFSNEGLWNLLLLNAAFSLATKASVTAFIARTSSLTATLALTFQRFISFVLSATVLSPEHAEWPVWFAMIFVSVGMCLYSTSGS